MAYIEGGVVKSKRSLWKLRTWIYYLSSIIEFIGIFFSTMFSMEKADEYKKSSGKKTDGRGPGGPGSGGGGGGGGPRGPPRGLDNVRGLKDIKGADHSALPACGSCCG